MNTGRGGTHVLLRTHLRFVVALALRGSTGGGGGVTALLIIVLDHPSCIMETSVKVESAEESTTNQEKRRYRERTEMVWSQFSCLPPRRVSCHPPDSVYCSSVVTIRGGYGAAAALENC